MPEDTNNQPPPIEETPELPSVPPVPPMPPLPEAPKLSASELENIGQDVRRNLGQSLAGADPVGAGAASSAGDVGGRTVPEARSMRELFPNDREPVEIRGWAEMMSKLDDIKKALDLVAQAMQNQQIGGA